MVGIFSLGKMENQFIKERMASGMNREDAMLAFKKSMVSIFKRYLFWEYVRQKIKLFFKKRVDHEKNRVHI